MKKHPVIIGEKVLVDTGEAVKLAVNAGLLPQLAQSGVLHALTEAHPAADGIVKRAFLVGIARHQHLPAVCDDHTHTPVEFSVLC